MRRELKILLATVALGGAIAYGDRVPEALSRVDTFRVKNVDVQGVRYVTPEEVIGRLGLTPESTVWGDVTEWRERVEAHPLIEGAVVTRLMPDGLTVTVTERRPVALVTTPTLELVDRFGVRLPLDPSQYRFDLPVVAISEPPADGSRFLPTEARKLLAEVARLTGGDLTFLQMVSEVRQQEDGTLVARWTEPQVDFLLPLDMPVLRLREGIAVLLDAVARRRDAPPTAIDLRFADQVVVRTAPGK